MLNLESGLAEQKEFLRRFPYERLPEMTLEEYTNLDRSDSFTYWIERQTQNLGGIAGGSSFKFGIYRRKGDREISADRYQDDNEYGWLSKYGNTREAAWAAVKQEVLAAAKAGKERNLEALEAIDLGPVYKWKIAALYSDGYIVPIYKKEMVDRMASELGYEDPEEATLAELHQFLANACPSDKHPIDFARQLLEQYPNGEEEKSPSSSMNESLQKGQRVWLIATGRKGRFWDEFRTQGYISIGWSQVGDLMQYDDKTELDAAVLHNYGDGTSSKTNDKLALWEFSHVMQPGDLVIAKKGRKTYLGVGKISGTYEYHPERGDHCNIRTVDWLELKEFSDEKPMVTKTLTDISKYPEYVQRLLSAYGLADKRQTVEQKRFWWLNANPKYWDLSKAAIGEEQFYTSQNEAGNPRQKQECFKQARPGELMIGYETSPEKKVTAILEVTQALHEGEEGKRIGFKVNRFLSDPIPWEELPRIPGFTEAEVLQNNQGSLFELKKDEFDALISRDLVRREEIDPYTLQEAVAEIFLSESELQRLKKVLQRKQNIILQGPPGTGKTFIARRLAYLMMGVKDNARIQLLQFHQSYAYEDFIIGLRPDADGNFRPKDGVFKRFCKRAADHPEDAYFCVIDEINRGNLSKIFGECMLLIEKDKRGPDYAIELPYSTGKGESFFIPKNLFLIGTMNTADRSLAMVDYALRRRFALINITPNYEERLEQELQDFKLSDQLIERILVSMNKLNEQISGDLGDDFQIGHSYFCPDQAYSPWEEWYREVIEFEIAPQIREYYYDRPERAEKLIQALH